MRTRPLAPLIAAAFLLGGCSAEAEPEPIFAEPEPSVDPSATESSAPEGESAAEYIHRWNDAQTALYAGDVDAYLTEYRDCDVCVRTGQRVSDYFANGGYIKTKGREIVSVKRDFRRGQHVHFTVNVIGSPTEYTESSDGPEHTLTGGPAQFRMTLAKDQQGWNLLTYVEIAQ